MPEESKVKRLGRVEFIEPNDLFVNSPGGKVQNGIPQPYEDYSFSVHLRVINGNRYDCGMTGDGGDISKRTIEFSSDKGTISFMDGTSVNGNQGYLTTNFTDISMNDPATNTKECLGIQSISVKFSSWYTPTVDISFVDVRGASLMQPAEYEYYNTGGPNVGKNDTTTSNSDFFKAFFSFPYPLFKLSIKGLYGKEVTYDLSVLKCNIDFDSNSGNFVANANFIGYMYGMYADLPFPFAYIAPYMELYGKNTWQEKKDSKDFCYLTNDNNNPVGMQMYTFPELKNVVKNAGTKADKELEVTEEGKRIIELQKLKDKIANEVHPYFPTTSTKFSWWSWTKTPEEEEKDGFFFVSAENSPKTNRYIFNDFLKFSKAVYEYNNMAANSVYYKGNGIQDKKIFKDIYERAKGINNPTFNETEQQELTREGLGSTLNYSDADIERIFDGEFVTLTFHKGSSDPNAPVLTYDGTNSSFGSASEAEYRPLIDELVRRFAEKETNSPMQFNSSVTDWSIKAFKINDISYKNKIVDILNNIKSELNKLIQERDRNREQKIDEAIGFYPSIKNLYNMIFAHIDTFMSAYYNTLDRIRKKIQSSDSSRSKETLCGSNSIQVDVNDRTLESKVSNNGMLPPFTMFYKEETDKDSKDRKITMIWPGDLPGGDELDEVKLVKAIINASSLAKMNFETVTLMDNITMREGGLVPTNYYDIVNGYGNPYLDILNEKSLNDEDIVKWVLRVFTLRVFYSLLGGGYITTESGAGPDGTRTAVENLSEKAKLVARLEVSNIERAFKLLGMKPTQNFKTQLLRTTNDGNVAMSSFVTGNKPMFIVSPGSAGDLSYCWIKKPNDNSTYLLPVGVFDRTTLTNAVNGMSINDSDRRFIELSSTAGTFNADNTCKIYQTSHEIENRLEKCTHGDFKEATRLFPSYSSVKPDASGSVPVIFSSRKTSLGTTSVFMDPLYYAQDSVHARAYLFLMGLTFGDDKKFFLPEGVYNGDYSTLLLLREGAAYWRNVILQETNEDPINYKFELSGKTYDVLPDIEKNDPSFGVKYIQPGDNKLPKNPTNARIKALIRFFMAWATGTNSYSSINSNDYEFTELPKPSVDFQEIERTFGLWWKTDQDLAKKFIGNYDKSVAPGMAMSSPYVGNYENAAQLQKIYRIGDNGELGVIKESIRTDVFLLDNVSSEDVVGKSVSDFIKRFSVFYNGKNTIIDYSTLDYPKQTFSVPRSAMNDALSEFIEGLKKQNNISTAQLKNSTRTGSLGESEDKFNEPEQFRDKDLKLACYIALKNMYDRWLCSRRRENWYFSCNPNKKMVNGIESDFRRFFYIDEFYHNIGMKIKPNLTNFVETMNSEGGFTDKSDELDLAANSILKMLSTTAYYAGCSLLTLPMMLGLARDGKNDSEQNSICDVFKAFPYNDAVTGTNIETSFIILYSSQKSSVLDVEDQSGEKNAYKSDGFDIANTWGEIVPQPMLTDSSEDGYVVPCFGVTFAKQNQSYFSNVSLSMEDHQVTEYSIRNEVMISYANNRGPRETTVVGQDLYSVYSNYSYSCSVEMLGDAQITPLMYFQLNNIAMWKGAYLITEVSHNISPNGFTTVFKGTRQSRPALPFKGDETITKANGAAQKTPYSQNDGNGTLVKDNNTDMSQRPLDGINIDDVSGIVFYLDRISTDEDETWVNGELRVSVANKDGTQTDYDNIATTREAIHGLTKEIWKYTAEENKTIFSLPQGKFNNFKLETADQKDEYRKQSDTFYNFTDGQHIVVTDESNLGNRRAEIITGETFYTLYESGGFDEISLGGISPIMIYGNCVGDFTNEFDENEIHATYREIFNLVKRMNEAKKPLSLVVGTRADINKSKLSDN